MSDVGNRPDKTQVVHKHYHLGPSSDCGCYSVFVVGIFAYLVALLAQWKALPWQ